MRPCFIRLVTYSILSVLSLAPSKGFGRDKIDESVAARALPGSPSHSDRLFTTKNDINFDKRNLQNDLLNSKFEMLEKELNQVQSEFRNDVQKEHQVDLAFSSFASTDPRFDKLLSSWIDRYPSSAVARVARGYYYAYLGAISRGTAYTSETRPEKLRAMERYFSMATIDFAEAIKRDSGISVAYGKLMIVARATGSVKTADKLLTAALQSNPGSYFVREKYLSALQPKWGGSMKSIRQFLSSVEAMIADNPELSALLSYPDYVAADTLMCDKKYQESIVYYTKALDAGLPVDMERGRTYEYLHQYPEALSDYGAALDRDPQDINSLIRRGFTYTLMKQYNFAMEDFDAAIQLDPLNPELLVNRAYVLQRFGRDKEAFADLQASLQYDAFNARTYSDMGKIDLKNPDNYSTAKMHFKRATQLAPDEAAYWLDYLGVLYKLKDCEIESPVQEYHMVCRSSTSTSCSSERLKWADKFLRFAQTNPLYGCKEAPGIQHK